MRSLLSTIELKKVVINLILQYRSIRTNCTAMKSGRVDTNSRDIEVPIPATTVSIAHECYRRLGDGSRVITAEKRRARVREALFFLDGLQVQCVPAKRLTCRKRHELNGI